MSRLNELIGHSHETAKKELEIESQDRRALGTAPLPLMVRCGADEGDSVSMALHPFIVLIHDLILLVEKTRRPFGRVAVNSSGDFCMAAKWIEEGELHPITAAYLAWFWRQEYDARLVVDTNVNLGEMDGNDDG